MPRAPKLRKKTTNGIARWFTAAGSPTYFGKCSELSHTDAKKLFAAHLDSLANQVPTAQPATAATVGTLMDAFLDWLKEHRSPQTFTTRRRFCKAFCAFVGADGVRLADKPASKIKASDLEAYKLSEKIGQQTLKHLQTSIKHMFSWGRKFPDPDSPFVPNTFNPFSICEPVHVPPKNLSEDKLMTAEEAEALFKAAEVNQDKYHKTKQFTKRNRYMIYADLLRVYHDTGARDCELIDATVSDFSPSSQQITLGKEKRTKKLKTPRIRQITLSTEATAIVAKNCKGKKPDDYIFTNCYGNKINARALHYRFKRIKDTVAKEKLGKVRDEITLYDFRHLWISDCLRNNVTIEVVAKMAGTSIAMIEKHYGHFRNAHLLEVQQLIANSRRLAKA